MGWFRKDRKDEAADPAEAAPAVAEPPSLPPDDPMAAFPALEGDAVFQQYELTQAIAGLILTAPELSDPEWDTYALVAEVSDHRVATVAYRYVGSGPPVPTKPPKGLTPFRQLRDLVRETAGAAPEVIVVKIHRDTADLVTDLVYVDDADPWRIRPENLDHLAERMRPKPEDFAG